MCTWLISVGIDWYRLISSRGGDVDYGKRSELSLEDNRISKSWVVIRESGSVCGGRLVYKLQSQEDSEMARSSGKVKSRAHFCPES